MLNDQQQILFREILDLNWELKDVEDPIERFELSRKLNAKKNELKNDMGAEEYEKFMDTGRRMFAPKVA